MPSLSDLPLAVTLDGSYGEGAGALVRTALSMSALTMRPLRIEHVRGGSSYPGISCEDITLLAALQKASNGEVQGGDLKSNTLDFVPKRSISAVNLTLDVPGQVQLDDHQNTCIIGATLIPVLGISKAYSNLTIIGETHGQNALSFEPFIGQTLAAFRKFGLYAFPDIKKVGFGKNSRGEISLEIEPSVYQGVQLRDRGELKSLRGIVTTCGLPEEVGYRGASHLHRMAEDSGLDIEIEIVAPEQGNPGAYVSVIAEYEHGFGSGTAIGSRGLRIEAVAQAAFAKYLQWMKSDATVDEYLADQILLLACFSEGSSFFRVNRLTQRFLTTVWVIKQFMPISIVVKGNEGGPGTVQIKR